MPRHGRACLRILSGVVGEEDSPERFRAEIQADNTVARRFFLGLTPTARERYRNGDVVVLINVAELLRMLD